MLICSTPNKNLTVLWNEMNILWNEIQSQLDTEKISTLNQNSYDIEFHIGDKNTLLSVNFTSIADEFLNRQKLDLIVLQMLQSLVNKYGLLSLYDYGLNFNDMIREFKLTGKGSFHNSLTDGKIPLFVCINIPGIKARIKNSSKKLDVRLQNIVKKIREPIRFQVLYSTEKHIFALPIFKQIVMGNKSENLLNKFFLYLYAQNKSKITSVLQKVLQKTDYRSLKSLAKSELKEIQLSSHKEELIYRTYLVIEYMKEIVEQSHISHKDAKAVVDLKNLLKQHIEYKLFSSLIKAENFTTFLVQ